MRQAYLEAGKIRNTHALGGEVKMEVWLDGKTPLRHIPALYLAPAPDAEKLVLSSFRRQGDVFLVLFSGIDSIEKAQRLKGKTLYARRDDVDPDRTRIFFADLIGLPLIDAVSGAKRGTIEAVESRGGGELFLIALPGGKTAYYPFVKEWIVSMDPEKGVTARVPEGIFD